MSVKSLSKTKVCYRIQNRDLLPKVRARTRGLCDMYYLETVFRKDSIGHGAGIGGEDISFEFWGQDVSINDNGRRFEIICMEEVEQPDGETDIEVVPMRPRVKALLERKLCKPGVRLVERPFSY